MSRGQPNTIRRYGRVQLCATLAADRRRLRLRTSALGLVPKPEFRIGNFDSQPPRCSVQHRISPAAMPVEFKDYYSILGVPRDARRPLLARTAACASRFPCTGRRPLLRPRPRALGSGARNHRERSHAQGPGECAHPARHQQRPAASRARAWSAQGPERRASAATSTRSSTCKYRSNSATKNARYGKNSAASRALIHDPHEPRRNV